MADGTMEIGSEFWNATVGPVHNGLFPSSVQWYLSGRVALGAILHDIRDARTAALPAWCCDTMLKPFLDAGLEVRFYPVVRNADGLDQEIDTSCDILLLMDHFGFEPRHPRSFSHPCVIRDTTHSLFSGVASDAQYHFGSLRKWCGVCGGGYAWSGHPLPAAADSDGGYTECRRRAMTAKARFMAGTTCNHSQASLKSAYLEAFAESEAILDHLDSIPPAPPEDIFIASHLDVGGMVSRRRANASILMAAFPDFLIFPELRPADAPLCVPVLIPDGRRDALRQHLIQRGIYLPVHWPRTPLHGNAPDPSGFYRDELSLVCDQRYSETDMERMVRAIREFLEG